MVEKFSDYEGAAYLNQEGEFAFEITEAELKDSKSGSLMWQFTAKSEAGQTTLYHTLNPKARWSLNNLIKACLKLDTKEKIDRFECDYEVVGQQLVGKKFIGVVKKDSYTKDIKVPNDDGTFTNSTETKDSYKVDSYKQI